MLLVALLACASPSPPASSDPLARPSTVVLVIACTARADRFGAWGHERDTSPYLDALAASGTRFARTLSNAGWTRPAVASLLTGLHPYATGVDPDEPGDVFAAGLSPEALTLAERFQAADWATIGLTANPNANSRLGMAQGFDTYVDTEDWRGVRIKQPGTEMVDRFLEQSAGIEGPLYAQLVLVDAHAPLEPERLRRARLGLNPLADGALTERYDAALTRLDEALVELDRGLEAQGRGDRLLVLIGDHGEGLFTPKQAGKGHSHQLYEANLHVPWVLHGAGVAAGQVVEGLSGSVDLAPTLASLAGLPEAEGDGLDLSPWARGQGEALPSRELIAMTRYGPVDKARITGQDFTLIQTWAAGGEALRGEVELYAAEDRAQRRELSAQHPEQTLRLRRSLAEQKQTWEERALRWQGEVDEEVRGQLEALGYVE